MAEHHLSAPLSGEDTQKLRAGDVVFLSGTIYTARDAAHKRLSDLLDAGRELPFDLPGAVIYYVGPSPAPEGRPIGAAGPTTSYRMDAFAPRLHRLGVKASIGKGRRNAEVLQALRDCGCVYFGATGGAGALLSMCVTHAEVIAFDDLGPEAVRRLTVKDLPLLVINDCLGGDLYVKPDLKAVGLA
jgi:fumarate hydratase subunit beta